MEVFIGGREMTFSDFREPAYRNPKMVDHRVAILTGTERSGKRSSMAGGKRMTSDKRVAGGKRVTGDKRVAGGRRQ